MLHCVFAHLRGKGIVRVMLFSLQDFNVRAVYERLHFQLASNVVPHWFVRSLAHCGEAPVYERPICDVLAAEAVARRRAEGKADAAPAPRGGHGGRASGAGHASGGGGSGGRWGYRPATGVNRTAPAPRIPHASARDAAAAAEDDGDAGPSGGAGGALLEPVPYNRYDGKDDDEASGLPDYWPEPHIVFASQPIWCAHELKRRRCSSTH